MKTKLLLVIAALAIFASCGKEWKPGMPLAKEKVVVGVLHLSDPFTENSGYAYAHQMGIVYMQKTLGLEDNQILYRTHVDYSNPYDSESAIRELIARGANIIFATSWGYMDVCEKLALEYPNVIFAHATGNKHNNTNFTNYFGRVYQARYLSGIIAGMRTKSGRIGYVAAWGTQNSEVTGGINAFAMGVEKVNPDARVYVKVTHSWFDPMGETMAARELIGLDCDVITQHVDTANPQIEAQRAGIWGIGYNTDMSGDAPNAVLTSLLWRWGAYYTFLVQSVIDGTFVTTPWYGSIADGIVDLAPLNQNISWDTELIRILEDTRRQIEDGSLVVFEGLSDSEVQFGIDWYHHTVIER